MNKLSFKIKIAKNFYNQIQKIINNNHHQKIKNKIMDKLKIKMHILFKNLKN